MVSQRNVTGLALHWRYAAFCLLLGVCLPNLAQESIALYQSAFEIHPDLAAATGITEPQIDGKLDDMVWQHAPALREFITLQGRQIEAPPVVASEIKLAYDRQFLYLALRAWDPAPAAIRAGFALRDQIAPQDDQFTVFIDSGNQVGGAINQGKQSRFFAINAQGVLADGVFHARGAKMDVVPDFEFSGRAQQDADGWTAELKIPLQQLRQGAQLASFALVITRNYVRQRAYVLRSATLVRDADCFLCVQYQPASAQFWPQPQETKLNLQAALNEVESHAAPSLHGVSLRLRANSFIEVEASVRTAGSVATGSQNNDSTPSVAHPFAQAKEESRAFFLSNTDLFAASQEGAAGNNLAVYTRSITDFAWGLRASTRSSNMQGVWLTSLDNGGGRVLLPSSYQTDFAQQPPSLASIAQARLEQHDIKLAALFSDRDYRELGYNRVMGSDIAWQLNPRASVRAQWLHSLTTARANVQGNLEKQQAEQGDAQRLEYNYRSARWEGVFYSERVSPGFRADNGFYGQSGYLTQYGQLTHKFGAIGPLLASNLLFTMQEARDWQGNLLRRGLRPALFLSGVRDASLYLEMASGEQQRVVRNGALHTLSFVGVELSTIPGGWLTHTGVKLNVGDKIDAQTDRKVKGGTLEVKLGIKPVAALQLKLYWLKEWLRHLGGSGETGANKAQGRAISVAANWQIDKISSLEISLSSGPSTRNPVLYERVTELTPLDGNLRNALNYQRKLGHYGELILGISHARGNLVPKRDAYLKTQWQF